MIAVFVHVLGHEDLLDDHHPRCTTLMPRKASKMDIEPVINGVATWRVKAGDSSDSSTVTTPVG